MIVFKPLDKEMIGEIFSKKVKDFLNLWSVNNKIKLPSFNKSKISKIVDEIYDPEYGARPLDRYIHEKIEPELIEQVMRG